MPIVCCNNGEGGLGLGSVLGGTLLSYFCHNFWNNSKSDLMILWFRLEVEVVVRYRSSTLYLRPEANLQVAKVSFLVDYHSGRTPLPVIINQII